MMDNWNNAEAIFDSLPKSERVYPWTYGVVRHVVAKEPGVAVYQLRQRWGWQPDSIMLILRGCIEKGYVTTEGELCDTSLLFSVQREHCHVVADS